MTTSPNKLLHNDCVTLYLNEPVEAPHEVVADEVEPAPLPVDYHGGKLDKKIKKYF